MQRIKKGLSWLCAVLLMLQIPSVYGLAEGEGEPSSDVPAATDTAEPSDTAGESSDTTEGETSDTAEEPSDTTEEESSSVSYAQYLEEHQNDERPAVDTVSVPAGQFSAIHPEGGYEVLPSFEGKTNVLLVQQSLAYVEYEVTVPQAGMYNLAVEHFPMNTSDVRYEIGVLVNGAAPFSQATSMYIKNIFKPESDETYTDNNGNEFAADRVVDEQWVTTVLMNPDNNFDEPLEFRLEAGTNRIRVTFHYPSAFVLGTLQVRAVEQYPTYEEYRAEHAGTPTGDAYLQVEAEATDRQSDSTLRPASDRTDRMTSPYSASKLLMNVIDSSWSTQGQWLEWDIEVKTAGFYKLTFRYQQEGLQGMAAGRRLFIDGEVPFQEATFVSFPYSTKWDVTTFANEEGEPYYIYLDEGPHTIRLESVLGDIAPLIRGLDDVVRDLNELYRQIIMITSTSPDKYRDYYLERDIPNLLERLSACSAELKSAYDSFTALGDMSNATVLRTLQVQLDGFVEDPRSIPNRITSFQTNIASMSSFVLDMRASPLALDYFVLEQAEAPERKMTSNFWDSIVHSLQTFGYSFVQDYDNFGSQETQETITIWLNTGRDQAQILWKMANDLFTPKYNIGVEVKLVGATMVEAFLSGNTPDVAINTTRDTPVNLALRGALVDLTLFDDFEDVLPWFQEDALVPYTLQDGVYGLPDTQVFNMLFYRTDIFEELDLEVPETWDEFISVANQLHLYQLETGVPAGSASPGDAVTFYSLLMQRGGELFPADQSRVQLDTPEAIDAFTFWTELYSDVGLPLTYDFFNRFRTGEMPMAIAPYTSYNQLTSAAPEIRNLWEMVPIPGIRQEDGTINRTQAGTGTAAVVLSASDNPTAGWKFIKWWASREAQARYSSDLESQMGVMGRVSVANKEALADLDWSTEQMNLLVEQHASVRELPQVPGNYYLDRDIINAFRDVTINGSNPNESLMEYSQRINGEIKRKREEFGLE